MQNCKECLTPVSESSTESLAVFDNVIARLSGLYCEYEHMFALANTQTEVGLRGARDTLPLYDGLMG